MASGYSIFWTNHALTELSATLDYLNKHWTEKELKRFSKALEHTIDLISRQPLIYPESDHRRGVRRALVDANNIMYYRVERSTVQILSVFSTRQSPSKRR